VRAESNYLEFNMAVSVQGWRKKWFYIQDQKAASSDQFGIAPFDAKAKLMKLTSWDSLPTEAEVNNSQPLLARIQVLKSATGGRLTGTQLMAFFLQRRIQPLQARISKLWSYTCSDDPSRVSSQDPEKKDVNKLVRSLTTLTKEKEIPTLIANFFDSGHPLPKVCVLITRKFWLLFSCSLLACMSFLAYFLSFLGSPILGFSPSSPREGTTRG
jgi:hypothetical protein